MARYECQRCHVTCHTTETHVCADVAKRLKRRERQVQEVETILFQYDDHQLADRHEAAEIIVRALANLNVTED